jgi:hypothetical protein
MSKGSCHSYKTKNIQSLVLIFGNSQDHSGLLKPPLLLAMKTTHKKARARRNTNG